MPRIVSLVGALTSIALIGGGLWMLAWPRRLVKFLSEKTSIATWSRSSGISPPSVWAMAQLRVAGIVLASLGAVFLWGTTLMFVRGYDATSRTRSVTSRGDEGMHLHLLGTGLAAIAIGTFVMLRTERAIRIIVSLWPDQREILPSAMPGLKLRARLFSALLLGVGLLACYWWFMLASL